MLRTVRGVATYQVLDLGLLRRIKQPLLIRLAPARLTDQPFRPLGREALTDIEHPGPAQAHLPGDGGVGHAGLAEPDDLPPALLLRRRGQLAHVHVPHAADLGHHGLSSRQ
jgi:hypothetical protein